MKYLQFLIPFSFALIAAVGNAIVTLGQKKATAYDNPFFFGAFSLLFASITLFIIASFYPVKNISDYFIENIRWFITTGIGLVLLNIFLYLLYRGYGASYYTVYAVFAIITTSILLSVIIFRENMNRYYWISLGFASLTIIFFMRGRLNS